MLPTAGYCGLCGHSLTIHWLIGNGCQGCPTGFCTPVPEYLGTIWEEGNRIDMASNKVRKSKATPAEKVLAAWYAMENIQALATDQTWMTEFMDQQRKVRLLFLGKQFERKSKDTRLVEICSWFAELLGEVLGDPTVTEKTKSFLAAQVAFSVRFSDSPAAGRYQEESDDTDYVE